MNMIPTQHFPCRYTPLSMGPCSTHSQRFPSGLFGFFLFFLPGDYFFSCHCTPATPVSRGRWCWRWWRGRRTIVWFLAAILACWEVRQDVQEGQKQTEKYSAWQLADMTLEITSNQRTGNITSGTSLNKYSIPAIFLRRMLSCSRISTCVRQSERFRLRNILRCLEGDGGAGLHPEDGFVFARVRPDAVLELLEVALVSQIEVRPRHVARRFQFTLSHVLQEEIYSGGSPVSFTSPELRMEDCF